MELLCDLDLTHYCLRGFEDAWNAQLPDRSNANLSRLFLANNRDLLFRYARSITDPGIRIPSIRKDLRVSLKSHLIKPYYKYLQAQLIFLDSLDMTFVRIKNSHQDFDRFYVLSKLIREGSGIINPHILAFSGNSPNLNYQKQQWSITSEIPESFPFTELLLARINGDHGMHGNANIRRSWGSLRTLASRKSTQAVWSVLQ